ncbi:cisplatin damage response ATP-dependent DNA ligase [Rhizobiales bacterium]|uniref:cisplatin damage response ATP-dependent DNA ligase n=1 Tax=Hongsoonwoonella zoysiae TaxID=2821844 RepID=UPI0015616EEB|nr:cisplatin damage response ATP-dependent DNA ligase [Hongsoonwoonella zoysiae]NRG19592.1 cisplatin damage response ATP-dependent DNA ligase [Hongsoonwoonella zoysiae]
MQDFAELLDRLSFEPRRNAKLALLTDYFASTPDPDRGLALAALTGELDFRHAKPAMLRSLIGERTDPVLFALSYDFVGDLSETIALMWPKREGANAAPPNLSEVVETLSKAGKTEVPGLVSGWLDTLDETGRWALLKLVTGGMRVGVSARLAKTVVAGLGSLSPDDVEEVWHGLKPPYEALFAWAEGGAEKPETNNPAPFRPPMLAHPIDEADFERLQPEHFAAEWKWDGIRVQAVAGRERNGATARKLFSRSGDDISAAFRDLVDEFDFDAAIDGELLVMIEGRVQSFNALQQRLNRKTVTKALMNSAPVGIRAYDLLALDGEDLRERPFEERRDRLEDFLDRLGHPALHVSPMVGFSSWAELASAREDPARFDAGEDAAAIEGVMLKRRDAPYVPGRPKGLWFKWKRDPFLVDAVLMYAQRGHGKRSSYYSDYTFGVWREGELVPVGKAYFGFTDEELLKIDRFVRNNTLNRFGPVREVVHTSENGLVLEIAFEGIARSKRHKSGLAMRFPRIARLRWDKPPAEADRIDLLEALVNDDEKA